jgi:hypothetical protein
MTIEISDVSAGMVTVTVSGVLKRSDLHRVQASALQLTRGQDPIRVLVVADRFLGWDRDGDEDDSQQARLHAQTIEKMAIVTDKKWQQLGSAFIGRRVRACPIEYFPPSDLSRARAWVTQT